MTIEDIKNLPVSRDGFSLIVYETINFAQLTEVPRAINIWLSEHDDAQRQLDLISRTVKKYRTHAFVFLESTRDLLQSELRNKADNYFLLKDGKVINFQCKGQLPNGVTIGGFTLNTKELTSASVKGVDSEDPKKDHVLEQNSISSPINEMCAATADGYDAATEGAEDFDRIYWSISEEYNRAVLKHPNWPSDDIYAAAIVQEEVGELIRAAVQYKMEGGDLEAMEKEAIQAGATIFRFLINLYAKKDIPLKES